MTETKFFRSALSLKIDPAEAAIDCVRQLGDGLDTEGALGFVYVTPTAAPRLNALVEGLRQHTGVAHWIGSVGLGIMGAGKEIYDQPAVSVMLAELGPGSFRMIDPHDVAHKRDPSLSTPWNDAGGVTLGVVHGDPENPVAPILVMELASAVPDCFIVGGFSSADHLPLQIADRVVNGCISGALIHPRVRVSTAHSQGCQPIGPRHIITACQRNVLGELDGRPALDVFKEDVGELLAKDLSRTAGFIFAGLSIAGLDTSDYLVRNLVAIDTSRKLLAIGDLVNEGQEVQFCRRDGNTAVEDLLSMLQKVKSRLSGPPRGALYFSCLARGRHQFGDQSEELRMVMRELGDCPVIGFFANGELFNSRLYGYTGVVVAFE